MSSRIYSGRYVQISAATAKARQAMGFHVEWDEGVLYHFYPAYDPPFDAEPRLEIAFNIANAMVSGYAYTWERWGADG